MSKFKVTSDFVINALCTVTIGAGTIEYCSNIIFNSYHVKYLKEANKNNQPVPLSESLKKRHDDVIQDFKLTDFKKAFVKPFTAKGINPVNVGCLNTRMGSYIGIPTIYDLNSVDDISILNIADLNLQKQYTKLINDKSEFGQQFLKSLILSEAAKKYSIARELMLTDSHRIFIKSVLSSVVLMPMYALGSYVYNGLPPNPARVRMLALFLLSNIGVLLWFFTRTAIENFYQKKADEKVCDIGEEYIKGGIEYYEKLIQRNLALRNILPDGENMYSKEGDQIEFISELSELPITYRKRYLENRLKKLINENKETLT
ncbi:transmembrane protein 177 [Acyrthosiphon pisum]|uniref:Transmembrane protein 177 n=1 Tax=Acyrthosiphon pisum TaxID=7029 RepID=A0A8R1WA61_ACYPI|nr:transmembrane protein 177 [Acyrthosiphon pisum]XP_003242585.1 transmembrane protein 177 [Acyrthosiphon pisum]XP_003242586.1 transmembrane protein 177 [Acyrthosiphon pisum]|eukprot:XP_001947318.2 PREDICTED: transmembrane protein 177 [Acyrthosiphon pisum]